MLFGHLAISVLQHCYLKADLASAIAGSVFPDVVDKTLCQVLRLTPSGRMAAHTLAGLTVSKAVVRLVWGRRAAQSWALGYLGHLLGDAGGFVPWLYPLVQYEFPRDQYGLVETLRQALIDRAKMRLELLLSAWAVCACVGAPISTRRVPGQHTRAQGR